MRIANHISTACLLLFGLGHLGHAADLNIVLLDSNSGHPLRWKLVCISYPTADSEGPVIEKVRECHRTDSVGTAAFRLPDPPPEMVDVTPATDGLISCFAPHKFAVAEAMKTGVVAENTCGDAATDTTQTGELVLYAHQKSIREVLNSTRDEF